MSTTLSDPYWGIIDSTVDWCESNYAFTPYIAELFNTLSSLPIAFYGLYGVFQSHRYALDERRHNLSFLALICVGLGSIAFHATLRCTAQASDELPMMWTTLILLYNLADVNDGWNVVKQQTLLSSRHRLVIRNTITHRWKLKLLLFTIGCLMTIIYYLMTDLFVVFAVGYMSMVSLLNAMMIRYLYCNKWSQTGLRLPKRLYIAGSLLYIVATAMWLGEVISCKHLPSWAYLHAFWHVTAGLATYTVVQAQMAYRAELHGGRAEFTQERGKWWKSLTLPFVKVTIKE